MTTPLDAAAVSRRIAILAEIGVGPLWLHRDTMLDNAAAGPPSSPISMSASASATAAAADSVPRAAAARSSGPAVLPRPPVAAPVPPRAAAPQSNAAAWDDDRIATPVNTALTLCVGVGSDGVAGTEGTGGKRYLFISRASAMQGADELFANILLALGLRQETVAAGDLAGLSAHIAALTGQHRPTALIVTEPAAALQMLGDGAGAAASSAAGFEALRGRLHRVGALPVLVTYGVAHLLRYPADKCKAWDDLCLLTALQASDVVDPA